MSNRRDFLYTAGGLMAGVPAYFTPLRKDIIEKGNSMLKELSLDQSITNEEFWNFIRQSYTVSASIINLNNGGVSPQPRVVQEAVERYNRLSNETPSYYMWRVLDEGREPLRRNLARLAGVSSEEIAINRNSTEALETVIFGLPLNAGDEVVLTKQDYPNMINAWKQREIRDGIKLIWLDFEFPIESKEEMVEKFVSAFTNKTAVVHLTHMINWMGQILPVAEIGKIAQERGIEVLVDAAHTFAHLDYKFGDLNCDYLGTSLHKWLCAPFGSGLLYVKKSKIVGLYPLFGAPDPKSDNIRKFEALGTRSFAIEQAIGQAILFHEMIGIKRKSKRLHFLKNYWAEKAIDIPGVALGTSLKPEFGGAICLVTINGKTPSELGKDLFTKYKIHTTSINYENIQGVRITPNVYTTLKELDTLVMALTELAKS